MLQPATVPNVIPPRAPLSACGKVQQRASKLFYTMHRPALTLRKAIRHSAAISAWEKGRLQV